MRCCALGVRLEDDPPARERGVEAALRELERGRIRLHKLDVSEPGGPSPLPPEGDHLGRDIGGHDAALGAGRRGGRQRWLTVSGGHVQDSVPSLNAGQLDEAFAHPAGSPLDQLRPLAPAGRRAGPLLALPRTELDGVKVARLHHHSPRLLARSQTYVILAGPKGSPVGACDRDQGRIPVHT